MLTNSEKLHKLLKKQQKEGGPIENPSIYGANTAIGRKNELERVDKLQNRGLSKDSGLKQKSEESRQEIERKARKLRREEYLKHLHETDDYDKYKKYANYEGYHNAFKDELNKAEKNPDKYIKFRKSHQELMDDLDYPNTLGPNYDNFKENVSKDEDKKEFKDSEAYEKYLNDLERVRDKSNEILNQKVTQGRKDKKLKLKGHSPVNSSVLNPMKTALHKMTGNQFNSGVSEVVDDVNKRDVNLLTIGKHIYNGLQPYSHGVLNHKINTGITGIIKGGLIKTGAGKGLGAAAIAVNPHILGPAIGGYVGYKASKALINKFDPEMKRKKAEEKRLIDEKEDKITRRHNSHLRDFQEGMLAEARENYDKSEFPRRSYEENKRKIFEKSRKSSLDRMIHHFMNKDKYTSAEQVEPRVSDIAFKPYLNDYSSEESIQSHNKDPIVNSRNQALHNTLSSSDTFGPKAHDKDINEDVNKVNLHDFRNIINKKDLSRNNRFANQLVNNNAGNTSINQTGSYKRGGKVYSTARKLQNFGRSGDTILAHINPQEALELKVHGGSGTISSKTGLREFRKRGFFRKVLKHFPAIVGTVGGMIAGGPTGSIAGGALGGSMVHGKKNKLSGVIKGAGLSVLYSSAAPVLAEKMGASSGSILSKMSELEKQSLLSQLSIKDGPKIGGGLGLFGSGGESKKLGILQEMFGKKPIKGMLDAGMSVGMIWDMMNEHKKYDNTPENSLIRKDPREEVELEILKEKLNQMKAPKHHHEEHRSLILPKGYACGGKVYDKGGYVEGFDNGRADTIPADLLEGSFVVPAHKVAKIGGGNSLNGKEVLEELMRTLSSISKSSEAENRSRVKARISSGEFVIPPGHTRLLEKLKLL